jgi:hypothetical protein
VLQLHRLRVLEAEDGVGREVDRQRLVRQGAILEAPQDLAEVRDVLGDPGELREVSQS